MQIQFLWWEGCPSHPEAWERLQAILAGMNIPAEVERIEIKTDEDAVRWGFPGSPTILVNGQDVDPRGAAAESRLTCRLYFKEDGRPSPLPTENMIKQALAAALDMPSHSIQAHSIQEEEDHA